MIFNLDEESLKAKNAFNTINEIHQQPKVFLDILKIFDSRIDEFQSFINNKWFDKKETKIIFTGAGTSEFIGNSLVHSLVAEGYDAESIATTNIVQNLEDYVHYNKKTLLVSFGRSGNSPESVATFEMMNRYVKDIKNLVITCNKDGALAKKSLEDKKNITVILPERSNDKSFAMTSSFSGMFITALLFLHINQYQEYCESIKKLAREMQKNMTTHFEKINELSQEHHERIVYLGSGDLNGIAQESHLKSLELTAGEVAMFFNSPMGFRHGPKSILNKKTLVVVFLNRDPYKRAYDYDILNELYTQKQADKIIAVDFKNDETVKKITDEYLIFEDTNIDVLTGLDYIGFGQLFGFYKSLALGKTPDNPWPTGEVNRVVKGVIIHKK